MKKLINRPLDVVREMVEGLAAVYPGLRLLPGRTVLVRDDAERARDEKVAVISGGGSGHEPAHAGYVGRGMLSAAVAGAVFTSPDPDTIVAAIRAVTGPPGVLLIVKNYTGDLLNFGLAAELARAEGIAVEVVVVADDVALAAATETAGRRGLAGTVLVHKVAGAAAEAGASLAEVAVEARAAAGAVRTMGVALSPCTVPAARRPGVVLGGDEIEIGLGIHGEPRVRRRALGAAGRRAGVRAGGRGDRDRPGHPRRAGRRAGAAGAGGRARRPAPRADPRRPRTARGLPRRPAGQYPRRHGDDGGGDRRPPCP